MKKIIFLSLVSFSYVSVFSQAGQWMWVRGSNNDNAPGSYVAVGVSHPANNPPASYESCEWKDHNGNFWLYGGLTWCGYCSDQLWKYNPVINEWTFVKGSGYYTNGDFSVRGIQGVASPANRPPALGYGAASWVDNNGNLWMYGGGSDPNANNLGMYNDLWKYNISTNEWTWMKGSGTLLNQPPVYGTSGVPSPLNSPGARSECAAAWTDNDGNLWLFGGLIPNSAFGATLNDLWKYDVVTNDWTWMKGSNLPYQVGSYNVIGVEDPANHPGARMAYARWKSSDGNLWLFGGADQLTGSISTSRNDLWSFNPQTNNWTWINGDTTLNSLAGLYGLKCDTVSKDKSVKRWENRAVWKDKNNNLWRFGGGIGGNTYNDLWMYCLSSNKWVWVKGDSTMNPVGVWGTMGVPDPANKPDGRYGGLGWTDSLGNFYFFGGMHNNQGDTYNDLWKFVPDSNCVGCTPIAQAPVAAFSSSATKICENQCINFFDFSAGNPVSWQWYFPNATPDTSTSQNPIVCFNSSGTYNVTLIVSNAMGTDTIEFSNYITVIPQPVINLGNDTTICMGDSLILHVPYDSLLIFHWQNGSSDTTFKVTSPGTYWIQLDYGNCKTTDTIHVNHTPCTIPVAAFAASDSILCINDCIHFYDLSVNYPSQWQWYFQGGWPATSTLQNPYNICYDSAGVYPVTLVASNLLGNDSVTYTSFINVISPPAPVITVSNDTLYSTPASGYQWHLNNNIIPGATNQYYVFTIQGIYKVVITDSNGCTSSSPDITTSIGEYIVQTSDLSIFPNPAVIDIHIEFNENRSDAETVEVEIKNILGQSVSKHSLLKSQNSMLLKIENYPDGIYFINIWDGENQIVKKFVVQHN